MKPRDYVEVASAIATRTSVDEFWLLNGAKQTVARSVSAWAPAIAG